MQLARGAVPITVALLCCLCEVGYAECRAPSWYKDDTVKRNGQRLTVVCHGEGATEELAEMDAKDKCASRAALEYRSTVTVNEVVVTTDRDAASHRETSDATSLVGLLCSNPKSWSCELSGETSAWRQCTYDLSVVHEGSSAEVKAEKQRVSSGQDAVANRDALGEVRRKSSPPNAGEHQRGDGWVLSLAVTPPCDDLVIKGAHGRRVKCTGNPVSVPIKSGDDEIVIRAKNYMPKTLLLNGASNESSAEVYLDPAD